MKIVYKILNTLAVIAVAPVLVFLPMFRFIMTFSMASGSDSSSLLGLLGGLLGNSVDLSGIIKNLTGVDVEHLPEFYTIPDVYKLFKGDDAIFSAEGFDPSALPEGLISGFRTAAIFLIAALAIALVMLIVGIVTKKKWINVILGGCGMLSVYLMNSFFSGVAKQIVSGTMSVNSILSGVKSLADYQQYLSYVKIDVRIFELSSACTMLYVVFAVLILINLAFFFMEKYNET